MKRFQENIGKRELWEGPEWPRTFSYGQWWNFLETSRRVALLYKVKTDRTTRHQLFENSQGKSSLNFGEQKTALTFRANCR